MRPLNPNADRISDLPDYVIDIILSRVPLRDAVRTSLLSTEWRYKWTSIPDLVFDPVFLLLKYNTENIVDQVLLQHRGTINKFVFKVPRHINSLNVDKWIHFLSNHQVQDFTLLRRNLNYRIPSRFFEFQHLRHLNLYRCILELPLGFKGFSRLVSLSCYQIDFTPAIFRQLVSQCPQLEKLRVFHWSKSDNIEVEGPKLRFFQFRGLFQSICFKNCPVLAEISLSTPKDDSSETLRSSYPKKYIHFVPTLEKVDLDTQMLEYLGAGGAPNRFPSSLNHLRVLSFSFFLDVVEEMSFALCLVRSSPNLQILRIRFHGFSIVEAIVEYIRVQKTPECSMNQLKKVEIAGFSGTECQVEFVAYLLAGAGALEEMVLSVCRGYDGLGLTNQLRQLPRASLNAQIYRGD